jgi:multidrug efflux system outer membrane protein
MVGPDYKKPQIEVSNVFANQTKKGMSAKGIEASWWRGFNDDKLNRLILLAVERNLDLRVATARLREAYSLRSEAEFELFPIITSGASYTRERVSGQSPRGLGGAGGTGADGGAGGFDRDFNNFDAGFDASWELDFFGRVRRSIEAFTADVEAAVAVRRDVIVGVMGEVARNYFELRGAQNQLEVARRNAENQQETLDLTIAILEGGRGTELDTSQARAQLNLTLATIPPLETAIKRAIHRLSVLTGLQPTALEKELYDPLPIPDLPKVVAIGNPGDLLLRRPDIRVAERNLAAATARIGVETADLFPRVTLLGSIALQADSFSSLFESGSDAFTFGPSIFWAAFDLGRVRARIRAADARTEATLAQYELAVLTALEEAENALVNFERQQVRRDFLRESAQASEKAVELAQLRYRYGVSDFLTVLDSERTLLIAQDLLAQSETTTATALIDLYEALGGGWEIERDNQYKNESIGQAK